MNVSLSRRYFALGETQGDYFWLWLLYSLHENRQQGRIIMDLNELTLKQ